MARATPAKTPKTASTTARRAIVARSSRPSVARTSEPNPYAEEDKSTFMGGVDVHAALDAGFGSIALLGATAVSLFLANSAWSGAYLSFWHAHVGPAALALHMSLHHWVNEGLMAIFFFAVGLEIKREFVHGSLRSLKQAALPCIGALGGMVVPMAVYLAFNNPATTAAAVTAGWAIPMATDIAFAMGVYNFFKNKMPGGVAAFLLTLATVDDLGAIAVIAVCFAKSLTTSYIVGAVAATGALFAACKKGVTNMAVYAALGVTLWYCLLQGGINADVAGVIAAFAVPAHASAPAGSDATPEHEGSDPTLLDHLVHKFAPLSALVIMPLFALANTGVPLDASVVGKVLTEPVGRGIMLGLLLGKPVGIAGLSWLAVKCKIGKLPHGMNNAHLGIVGLLGGIGFTMCLFLVEMALAGHASAANTAKLAVLASSTIAATVGAALMAGLPSAESEDETKLKTA
jgi:NhaA family Na+:H+ antiporter